MNKLPQRDRKSDLFHAILDRARADGSLCRIEPILEYILPNAEEPLDTEQDCYLTNYRFDIYPSMMFGCEGIFVELCLIGEFDGSGKRQTTSLGIFKTLRQDLDACRLMGELCGVLMYHGRSYVNDNIQRYTPDSQLNRNAAAVYYEKEDDNHDVS